jgi:hypothetical protein
VDRGRCQNVIEQLSAGTPGDASPGGRNHVRGRMRLVDAGQRAFQFRHQLIGRPADI